MKKYILLIVLTLCSLSGYSQYSGTGPVTLTAPTGSSNIQWYSFTTGGAVMISGETNSTYATSTSGVYYATFDLLATPGCSNQQTVFTIIMNDGDTTVLNGATNNSGGTNYQWTNAGVDIGGATTNSYSATAGGLYQLTYEDGVCDLKSDEYLVFVLASEEVMISQLYHSSTLGKIIEVTNTSTTNTIGASTLNVALYTDTAGDKTGVTPDASYTITGALSPGQSALIKSSGASVSTVQSPVEETNAGVTTFDGGNDILIITSGSGSSAYANRIDVIESFSDNTSYVRVDDRLTPNDTYTASEWVAYVDDALDPYRVLASGGPERHPQDPLLSEINTAKAEANNGLGLHRINGTTRTGSAWSNGVPDYSRTVTIDEDYNHTGSVLNLRNLVIDNSSKLAITDNLLVVSDAITLTGTDDELRLVGSSQLVQTHTGAAQITGTGKLLVEQNPLTASIYRYNYMSSPVNTIGASTYTIASVFKDGTTALDATTAIGTVAKDITFVAGYDGSATDPISLAEHWIYSYAPGVDGRSNWVQELKSGTIPQTDGFIFKGPGIAQNYTFVGTPKDGDLAASTIGSDESYLVGNPFASSLSVKKFIEDNLVSTTATLYFWEQIGEEDTASSADSGHYFAGYIGGYATRNIAMGLSANDPTLVGAFDVTLQAEAATIVGSTDTQSGEGVVIMNSATSNSVEFTNIIKGVDVLKVNYISSVDKDIVIKIDNVSRGTFTLPAAGTFTTFDITLCIETGADVLIESYDTNVAYLNYIQLQDADGQITCEPGVGTGGTYTTPEPYVAIGQGFFIQGSLAGGPVVFNNSQREFKTEGAGSSVFFRESNTAESESVSVLPLVKLGMDFINDQGISLHRQFGASFNENNSLGVVNIGYDSQIYDIGTTDAYWKLPGDELKYVIVGAQEIADDLEVPFDIIMNSDGSVVLQIDEIKAIDRDLFIKDALLNKTYLLNDGTVALQLPKGTHTGRFSLAFRGTVLGVDDVNEALGKDLSVFMDASAKELVIHNLGDLTINKVELFNIIGQKINEWKTFEDTLENRLKTKNLLNQIYIVNIKTDKGTISKKIVNKNN